MDDEFTPEEAKAVAALRRPGRRWPRTLTLLSMSGSLVVVHTDDSRLDSPDTITRTESILDHIEGIPNDGGDW